MCHKNQFVNNLFAQYSYLIDNVSIKFFEFFNDTVNNRQKVIKNAYLGDIDISIIITDLYPYVLLTIIELLSMEGLVSNLDIFVYLRQNRCFKKVLTTVNLSLSEEEQSNLKMFCAISLQHTRRLLKKIDDWLDLEIKWPEFV